MVDEAAPRPPESDPAKLGLERKKLALEVEQLRRNAWFHPSALVPLVAPLMVAVLGIGAAYLTGWFDLRRENLKLGVEELTRRHTQLQQEVRSYEETVERSKCALGVLSWEKEILRRLIETQADPRDAILEFLDEWGKSGVSSANEYYQSRAMLKGGFAGDYHRIVSEGSDNLQERPSVTAICALRVHPWSGDDAFWSFIGKLAKGPPPVLIFVLLWVRTPKELGNRLSNWEEFPDLLKPETEVHVTTPFTSFYSVGISQDEDVYAICQVAHSDRTLQEELIERGLAVYYKGRSVAPYGLHRRLEEAQQKARSLGSGFWGRNATEMERLAAVPPRFESK